MKLHAPTLNISSTTTTFKPQCITLIQPPKQNTTQPSQTTTLYKKFEKITSNTNLSSSPLPPIPKKVSKRWKEYQGMTNWEGLLDPLDENLRSEILRYGHFVEASYKSFEFDPSSPNYATCKFPKKKLFKRCRLPKTGYEVTKHLHATSGIQLPTWVDKAPSWVATKSSYIGYVAVCEDKDEIKRLGRRDVVIAFRGTTTCLEWLENLRATLTHINPTCNSDGLMSNDKENNKPMVESGFFSLYTSKTNNTPSLQEMVRKEIGRVIQKYKGESLSLTITGHSLGAALAILTAYDIKTYFDRSPLVTVISFGGPRVGNRSFRSKLDRQGTKVLRIVNSDDVITKMPGFVLDDVEGNGDDVASFLPSWIQKTQWVYSEVGEELRLCSRDSPYLRGFNVATCHDLNTYLHLVDGFVSSECPFRSTAKRFLHK